VHEQKASDLHFVTGAAPIIRHDGELVPIKFRTLSTYEARRFLYEIMNEEQKQHFEANHDLDFAYHIPNVARFRVYYFRQERGIGAVFRIIPDRIPSIDQINAPKVLKKFAFIDNGMVLVTGPTGSGKSTTLAAIVNEINAVRKKNILTIEDPIEFVHQPKQSVITQREVGKDAKAFNEALRSAMRGSFDVVLVGELRDLETISMAATASEMGCLVLSTLHTNSAAKTISRIVDAFPQEEQDQVRNLLSMTLRGVVSQQLIKRKDDEGRVAAMEILTGSIALSNLIRENKIHQIESLIQVSDYRTTGMTTMDQSLVRLVDQGLATAEAAREKAYDKAFFDKTLQERAVEDLAS
jgi:twitching motility protein PilT